LSGTGQVSRRRELVWQIIGTMRCRRVQRRRWYWHEEQARVLKYSWFVGM
jgi:hypothetical protein